MSTLKFLMVPMLAIAALVSLSGCVAYPAYGGGGGYYAPGPVVVAAPVYRPYYYGGGWGRGRWR